MSIPYHPTIASLNFFPTLLREAEKKDMDVYEKVPLFDLEQQYQGTETGRTGFMLGFDGRFPL